MSESSVSARPLLGPPEGLSSRQRSLQDLNEEEFLLRSNAFGSLSAFAETCDKKYRAAAFHELLASKLEDCFSRKIRRLAISMPPRHGKSKLTSVNFPAWALTKNPSLEVMQAGYSAVISGGFSGEVKELMRSPRYRTYFPDILDPRLDRTQLWATMDPETKERGGYFATSVGGGGVGRGADLLIIDDPIKNREEANSVTNRERIWNWFISTATTRLSPDGVVIIILTRWHEDDLIGRVTDKKRVREFEAAGLPEMNFEVLNLEAICENPDKDPMGRSMGQALWPERWDERKLLAAKLEKGRFEWASQYQGRPNPPGGNLLDIKNVKVIKRSEVPMAKLNGPLTRGWDLAVSDKNMSDYSVGAYGGMDTDGNFYLVHVDRDKRLWPEQKAAMYKYIDREAIGGRVGIEAVGAWELAASDIREKYKGRVIVKSFSPKVDKLTRALPWMALIDAGKFHIVEGDWNQDFLDEVEQFPNVAHDDQVDAVTVLWELFFKKFVELFA